MSDRLFLAEVRAALLVEAASVTVGVAAPQLRGRIAARERERHRLRLRVAAAAVAVLGVAAALPVAGGLVLPAAIGPPPGGVQPASVAAIEPTSGDLVLAWAWPNGTTQAGLRYPGALDLVRRATGDRSLTGLPDRSVATAGPDERLAVALPTGDILVYRSPDDRGFITRVVEGLLEETWLGWAEDGRLVAVGRPFAAPDARLRLRIVDPDTGGSVEGTLRYGTWPYAPGPLLTWTDRGTILAQHHDPRTFATTIGSVDITNAQPWFAPGLPARVRVATGLEPALARDGSVALGWSPDGRPGWSSVGVGGATDEGALGVRWYAAGSGERVFDVVRSADLLRLVALVARPDGSSPRVVLVDWPGSWRDAVTLADRAGGRQPRPATAAADAPGVVGLAPDGRSIAADIAGLLVIADLATGASVGLPPGTVFLGWPEPTVAVTEAVPTALACAEPSTATAASIALAAAGTPTPAEKGARPVVGERNDPDPWRHDRLETADRVEATAGSSLVLGLPVGACVDAFRVDAMPIGADSGATATRLGGRGADGPATAGLLELDTPPAGDWILRVTLWLVGADREAILLYHVGVVGP